MYTIGFALGQSIPTVNIPKIAPAFNPLKDNVSSNICPKVSTQNTKIVQIQPIMTDKAWTIYWDFFSEISKDRWGFKKSLNITLDAVFKSVEAVLKNKKLIVELV